MTINDEHQIVFIHVPKCAGSSLVNLKCFQQTPLETFGQGHTTIQQVFDNRNDKAKKYLKIAVVRDPVSRILSAYVFLKRGGLKTLGDLQYKRMIDKYMDFEDFVQHLEIDNLTSKIVHLFPMHFFVCLNSGKIGVDLIFYFEKLEMLHTYLKFNRLIQEHDCIPCINQSSDPKPLVSSKALDMIKLIYKKDYELFYPNNNT